MAWSGTPAWKGAPGTKATSCVSARRRSASASQPSGSRAHTNMPPSGRLWLEPEAAIHPTVSAAIAEFDAVIIGPGSFFTSLMPPLLVRGVREALACVRGPIILIANLLTEGRGMAGFTAADAVARLSEVMGRPVDIVIFNVGAPNSDVLARYASEHKAPLPLGNMPTDVQVIEGVFWRGPIARHDRRRLRAAVWAAIADRLLMKS